MPFSPERFDERLGAALARVQDRTRGTREAVLAELPDAEASKDALVATRAHTVQHLDRYLEQFADRVEGAGGHVHWAADAAEATATVLGIAQAAGARRIVKSKSMVSEEIGLNRALEQAGCSVVETDLGEYIVQVSGEAPSHIIVPAVHKTRGQVRELFSGLAGTELPDDARQLCSWARGRLREEFLAADLGITGCNFGVASTGSVVIVTNEGNGRLVSTLPRTHVVVMGMERLVPDWQGAAQVLSLLPRSATGQRLTSYVSAITGPGPDGPADLHVVILDNGRSNLLGTPFQDVLHCIRCGACINVCPVYRHAGGHAYDAVYPGPIGAVLTPLLSGKRGDLPDASSLCGACDEACPARIPLSDHLVALRALVRQRDGAALSERLALGAFAQAGRSAGRWDFAVRHARAALWPWIGNDRIAVGPPPLRGWTAHRELPAPARESFRAWWERTGKKEEA